jgi:hypothetical protein
MKLVVIVDSHGKVVGTYRPDPMSSGVHAAIVPQSGQTVHEIEAPEGCEKLSAAVLHERINSLLRESRTPPRRSL